MTKKTMQICSCLNPTTVLYQGAATSLKELLERAVAVNSETKLWFADLSSTDLRGAILSGAELPNTEFRCARLSGARLARAHLYGADFSDADLSGADLTLADFTRSNLEGANLANAIIRRTEFEGANFAKTNVVGAKLSARRTVRAVLQLSPLGSRQRQLLAWLCDDWSIRISTGCFHGSLWQFETAVARTHGTNVYGRTYDAAITFIKAWAKFQKEEE